MANKDEYYQKIIVALQSDISSNKSGITELKSMIAKLQKEIEELRASLSSQLRSSIPQQTRIDLNALLSEVKRVCDNAIIANYEWLPTMFADRQEFERFRQTVDMKFLPADTFTGYKKKQETRLKSIEENLGRRFSLLTINFHAPKNGHTAQSYLNFGSILNILKGINTQSVIRILICLLICLLAVYLISSITY